MAEETKTAVPEKELTREEKIRLAQEEMRNKKIPVGGYIALIFAILVFSGALKNVPYLQGIDFTKMLGAFGKIGETGQDYLGKGATGARYGFQMFLSVAPTVMLATGIMSVVEWLGGIDAAGKLLSFILKPVMGVPGYVAMPMVASLTSSDAGAAMNRDFHDRELLTDKERDITTMWLLCCAGILTNYITGYGYLSEIVTVPFIVPFIVLFILKFIEANIVRFTWDKFNARFEKKAALAAEKGEK